MEDFNADNRRIDSLASELKYVKLADIVTTATASSMDIDLSGIDFYEYSQLDFNMNLLGGGGSTDVFYMYINNLTSGYAYNESTNSNGSSWTSMGHIYTGGRANTVQTGTQSVSWYMHPEGGGRKAAIFATNFSGVSTILHTSRSSLLLDTLGEIALLTLKSTSGSKIGADSRICIYGLRR